LLEVKRENLKRGGCFEEKGNSLRDRSSDRRTPGIQRKGGTAKENPRKRLPGQIGGDTNLIKPHNKKIWGIADAEQKWGAQS